MIENHKTKRVRLDGVKQANQRAILDGAAITQQPEHSHAVNVGQALRALCVQRGLSIRALAEKSGLAVNTLSLIQNNKTSPSVSTLQQLASALDVPITAFFENGLPKSRVVYFKANQRIGAAFAHGTLEDLGGGLLDRNVGPFIVTMKPNVHSFVIGVIPG